MANSAVVGILRAMLTADTAQFDSSMRRAAKTQEQFGASVNKAGAQIRALTPQAERMVKSFQGDKLLYQANNITAAVQKLGGAQKLTAAEQTRVNGTLTQAIAKYQALGQSAPASMVALERATRNAGKGTDFLSAKMVALGAAAGTLAAQFAGQLLRGLVNSTKQAIEFSGQLVDMSNQTGLSTRTLQRMDAVAGQTGTTLEALSNVAFRLNTRISGGGDSVRAAVEELGLSFEKIRGQRIDQQFEAILPALGKIKDESKRNEIAVELFGQRMAKVALGAAKDYEAIANAAKLSTDEQLQQLDIVGDRLDQLGRDINTFWRNQVADAAFAFDQFKKIGWGDLFKIGIAAGPNPARIAEILSAGGAAAARREAERKKATEESARATQQATQTQIDYVAALKEAEGQLKNLDAAERRQIDAAQKTGAEQEALEEMLVRFGVSAKHADTVLKLYNESQRAGSRSTRSLASAHNDLADAADKSAASYRAFLNMVGEREIENIQKAQDAADKAAAELRQFNNMIGEREIEDVQRANEAKIKADAEWRAHQNMIGERMMEEEALQIEARKRRWLQFRDFVNQSFDHLFNAVGGNLGSILFGGGDDAAREQAKEAKAHFEELKRSGKASAEELTRAFREWRQAEEKANSAFADRFKSLWSGIKRALTDILDQILGYFVKSFLGGMLKALANTALGQKVGGWIMNALGLGGGGGIVGAATNAAAGAAIGAVTGGGAAAATGLFAATPAAVVSQGVSATVAGGAAAGAGGGFLSSVGAFATNPWTLAAAGAIVGGLLLAKKFRGGEEGIYVNPARDKFSAQFRERFGGSTNFEGLVNALAAAGVHGEPARQLIEQLQRADKKKTWSAAQDAFLRALTRGGLGGFKKFHDGGLVPGIGEQWAKLLGGESVLTRRATAAIGGLRGVSALNKGIWNYANLTEPKLYLPGVSATAAIPSNARQRPFGDNGTPGTIVFRVEAVDTEGFERVFNNKLIPLLKREVVMPRHGLVPLIQQRVLG